MTPDEVIAASGGEARSFSDKKKHDPRLGEGSVVAEWVPDDADPRIGRISFPVRFWFINGLLAHVNIEASTNPQWTGEMTYDFLTRKYGEPYKHEVLSIFYTSYWRLPQEDTDINFTEQGSGADPRHPSCPLVYKPLGRTF